MEDNYDESYNLRHSLEEDYIYVNSEKNIDYVNINQDEQKDVNTHVNNGFNTQIFNSNNNNYKNSINENDYDNQNININIHSNYEKLNQNLIYSNYSNINDLNNNNKEILANINEACINSGDIVQVNMKKYLEQIENKKTNNSSNITVNLNGKQINTSNEAVSCALNEYFHTNEINLNNKINDMQFLKKKKKEEPKKKLKKKKN